MKTQNLMQKTIQKTSLMLAITVLAGFAHAASLPKKKALRVDFNEQIETTASEKTTLAQDVTIMVKDQNENATFARKQRQVVDFIDLEVGWEAEAVVDNSSRNGASANRN